MISNFGIDHLLGVDVGCLMELSWLYFIIGVATELLTVLLKAWFEFDECVISTLVASFCQHLPYFLFY